MDQTYRTKDGDVFDELIFLHYGRQDQRLVETVLEANTGLAEYGPELPAGLLIVLPEIPETSPQARLTLFS